MSTLFTSYDLQRFLGTPEDDSWDDMDIAAAKEKLGNPVDRNGRPWSKKRIATAIQQAMLVKAGYPITVDGLPGQETVDAINRYQIKLKESGQTGKPSVKELRWWKTFNDWWDTDDQPSPIEGKLPVKKLPTTPQAVAASSTLKRQNWPKQKDVPSFYGAVGENQVRIELPYQMRIAWEKSKTVKTLVCHKKVAPSMLRCLQAVNSFYSPEQLAIIGLDLYGGCLNVRRMRGGSSWSMHSWGIAVDFDPDRNQLAWNNTRARLAKPDAKAFWEIWEAEGWTSLGRDRNFDWMHVQAASL